MVSPDHVMVAEWFMFAVAYIFLGLRVAVRLQLRQTHLLGSDVWLVLGALCLLGLVICDTLTYRQGGMSNFDMVSESLGKIRFATNYFFDAGLYMPKLSMLVFYFSLIPRHHTVLRWALYVVTAFTASATAVTTMSDTFWCGANLSTNWSTDPNACSSFTSMVLARMNWSLCISSEILILLLPFPVFRDIQTLNFAEKAGVIVLFALGALTVTVSTGRFLTMMSLNNDISIYIWATTELSVSIIVVAATALRPLLRRIWALSMGAISSSRYGPQSQKSRLKTGATNNHLHAGAANTATTGTIQGASGSEIELNPGGGPGKILRTERFSISSQNRADSVGSLGGLGGPDDSDRRVVWQGGETCARVDAIV